MDANKAIIDVFTADADKPERQKVTDPALLSQLNSPPERQKVTDPAILSQLNSAPEQGAEEQHFNPIDRGAGMRMLGVEELINNLGVGKHIGLPSNEILDEAAKIAEEQGKGTGAGGWIGEQVGDPLNWMGGAFFKGAKTLPAITGAASRFGAASGITSPGNTTPGKAVQSGAEGAVLGGALGGATTAIPGGIKGAKMLGEGFAARGPEELHQAAQQIRSEADEAYTAMREANAYIHPEAIKRLQESVRSSLEKKGIMNSELHRGTLSVLKQFQKVAQEGVSLEKADQFRRLLSGLINDRRGSEDAKMAATAIRAIDEAVDGLTAKDLSTNSTESVEALNKARSTWAKARKFETVADILEKSANDPNRRKVLLEQLANNKAKTRGWSDAEKKALRDAANNNTFEGLTKMAGKFGITLGSGRAAATGNVIPAVEMLAQGVKKGGAVVTGGTIAKMLQNVTGKAKAERLLKLIEAGKITPEEALGAVKDPLAYQPQLANPQPKITSAPQQGIVP